MRVCNRADRPTILKISADHVRIQIKSGISSEGANEEILVRVPFLPPVCCDQADINLPVSSGKRTPHFVMMSSWPAQECLHYCLARAITAANVLVPGF